MLVLSPIFSERVSPRKLESLPITESSKTISNKLEKEPMIEFFTMQESKTVCSPMATLGPIIEFFTLQFSPILTGGMMTVF